MFHIPKWCLIGAVLIGCGGQPPAMTPIAPSSLSLDQWRQLPVQQKYAPETLQVLRSSDPKLADERAWARTMQEVVAPERVKDLPGDFQTH